MVWFGFVFMYRVQLYFESRKEQSNKKTKLTFFSAKEGNISKHFGIHSLPYRVFMHLFYFITLLLSLHIYLDPMSDISSNTIPLCLGHAMP